MNPKTDEQQKVAAKRLLEIEFNRAYSGLKRSVKTLCAERGVISVKLHLKYLEENPTTQLPRKNINHAQTVECYKESISEYLSEINYK